MTTTLETFLLTQFVFPAAVALAATWGISRWVENHLRNRLTASPVESDLANERLDPINERNADFLVFALVFNVAYLTVDPTLVNQLLFNSPVFYACALVFFLLGLFMVLNFELRFISHRYSILGVAFAAVGTVIVLATIRLGFAQGTATGSATGTATGLIPGSHVSMILVPLVLIACAWSMAVAALVAEGFGRRALLPLRIPLEGPFRTLSSSVVFGYIGILLCLVPTIIRLA